MVVKTMQNWHRCNVKTKIPFNVVRNCLFTNGARLLCNVNLPSPWHTNCKFLTMHRNRVLYVLY